MSIVRDVFGSWSSLESCLVFAERAVRYDVLLGHSNSAGCNKVKILKVLCQVLGLVARGQVTSRQAQYCVEERVRLYFLLLLQLTFVYHRNMTLH